MIFELDDDEPDPERSAARIASAPRRAGKRAAPPNPFLCGDVEFRHRFISGKRLSGDFLCCRNGADDCAHFLFGDVSGSGAEAARVAEHLRARFDALEEGRPPLSGALRSRPSRLLRDLDRELRALNCGRHVTAFVGALDVRRRILHYSAAGQWPMPALRTAAGVRTLKGDGPPLGMFEGGEWKDHRCKLPAEFLLAFCTDGVTEHPEQTLLCVRNALAKKGARPMAERVRRTLAREAATGARADDALVLTVSNRA